MGTLFCCSQSNCHSANVPIITSNHLKSQQKCHYQLPDTSSTSDSQTQNLSHQDPPITERHQSFTNFINQRNFEMSSIKKISVASQCSQQKTFIKYLQRLQKQLSPAKEQRDLKAVESIILESGKTKMNLRQFMEHSTKCPICYELFQNLKNMDCYQTVTMVNHQESAQRISLRDSLLEFDQCQKAKRCAQCKCQVLNSHEEAEKAMRKFPNSNKYQSKNLKFRKTSLFEPQINEQRQSQES